MKFLLPCMLYFIIRFQLSILISRSVPVIVLWVFVQCVSHSLLRRFRGIFCLMWMGKEFFRNIKCSVQTHQFCLFIYFILFIFELAILHFWLFKTQQMRISFFFFFFFLTFTCPCIASISLKYNQQDATIFRSVYFYKLLYMFQAVPPPIVRSTKLYIQRRVLFTCFVIPYWCICFVQFAFDVSVLIYLFCLFVTYEFDVHIYFHHKYIPKIQPTRCNVFFLTHGSVHHDSMLIKRSNLMQQYADIYSLQSHSTCFGCHSTHHQEY